MSDEVTEENAVFYVMGLLPVEEAARFEAQLGRDAGLREMVRELRESSGQIALAVDQHTPPAGLSAKVLRAARREHATRSSLSRWIPWAIAAGLAFLATLVTIERQSLTSSLAEVNLERQSLASSLAEVKNEDNFSKLQTAALTSQSETAPNTVGAVAWDGKQQRGVVTITKLPPLEPNQDYQMWVIDPQHKQPISGGIVQVDENGTAKLVFTVAVPIRSADAFAVSREQKGGSTAPGGPILLMGR